MQSGVFAFVVINVDGDFAGEVQRSSVSGFHAFQVGPEDIVGVPGRNALGELAHVVGVDLPLCFVFLVLGRADLHVYAVHGAIVGTPDSAENEGVRLLRIGLPLSGTWAWAEA